MDIEDFEFQDGDVVEHTNIGHISISPVDDRDEDPDALIPESEIAGKRWWWFGPYPNDSASGICTDAELREGAEIVWRPVWTRQTG